MSVALCWLGAALALLVWPAGAPVPASPRRSLSRPALTVIACALTAAAALALGGAVGMALSLVACPLVVVGLRRMPVKRPRGLRSALPLALDLVAAALRAGHPVESALLLAAPAAGELSAELTRVAGLLRLGADTGEAWRAVASQPQLAAVAAAARRSSTSGLRLAAAFEQTAAELRAEACAAAEGAAARSGVLVLAPVGLCFLPAFVCLGIVPAVVGIGSGVLATVG